MCDKIVLVIAFGPSIVLIVWALWAHFTTDDPPIDEADYYATAARLDFLEHRDTWGRQ